MSRFLVFFLTPFALLPIVAAEPSGPPMTEKKPLSTKYHDVTVVDPYQWLADAKDPKVQAWTDAQNKYARAHLDRIPSLMPLRKRLKDLMAAGSASYASLQKRGDVWFALKADPKKDHPFLITMKSPQEPDPAKVVVDPNVLDPKGKTTIDFYVPSWDGKLVAVSMSEGGSEEGHLHLFDVATGKKQADFIPRVNLPTGGGDVAWDADDRGFVYTRYPRGTERPKEDLNFYLQLYHHKLGTDTKDDIYVLGKDFPRIAEIAIDASPDRKWLLATTQNGDGGEFMHHLRGPDGKWRQLTHFEDQITAAAFGGPHGSELFFLSLRGTSKGKILRVPLAVSAEPKPFTEWRTFVEESDLAIEGFRFAPNRFIPAFLPTADGLYVSYSDGGYSRLHYFPLTTTGRDVPTLVQLPTATAILDIVNPDKGTTYLHTESYLEPTAWYACDEANRFKPRKIVALSKTSPADFSDCEVLREFATSKDGTKVPLSIIQRKGTKLDGANPTLLTGYGGYGISLKPRFSAATRAWLEQGGVFVVANLRGGSEYGDAWHQAGALTRKQNVFDDFAACAKHLIERKYTSPEHLAIEGTSNGGLLMGASLVQHPELYRAVVAKVGIYDMLRAEDHPNGAFNVTEFGTVKNPDQFAALLAYSPYYNVKDGVAYPAVLLRTGANDGRVDPANSRKMAARLQSATSSKRPILLLVDADSGHGIGAGLSEAVAKTADMYAFLFEQLDVKYRDVKSGPQEKK